MSSLYVREKRSKRRKDEIYKKLDRINKAKSIKFYSGYYIKKERRVGKIVEKVIPAHYRLEVYNPIINGYTLIDGYIYKIEDIYVPETTTIIHKHMGYAPIKPYLKRYKDDFKKIHKFYSNKSIRNYPLDKEIHNGSFYKKINDAWFWY